MNYSLALQTTYDYLEIGLFGNEKLVYTIQEDKKRASATIIVHIDNILKKGNLSISDLRFIAVNQGPAPFTSLRVVISTVNGIGFTSKVPLIGIDGLLAFVEEYKSNEWPNTITLLNAFNNDVYFSIQQLTTISTGCENIESFLARIKNEYSISNWRFIGQGVPIFRDLIINTFPNAYIPKDMPFYCSLKQLSQNALQLWQQQENISQQVLPLYLKRLQYKASPIS